MPAPAQTTAAQARDRVAGRRSWVGVALVLAAALLFAVNGTVSKLVLQSGLSPLHLVQVRCTGAAVVLLAVVLVRSPASLRVTRGELGTVALLGIVGVALVQWLYYVAISRMPVSVALLLEFTAPILVALWVRFGRRRAVHRRVWLALPLVLAGLALVAQVWSGLTLDALGLLAGCGAAVSLAAYYLLAEQGVGRRDPLSLTALAFAAAALFWAVLQPWWLFPFADLTEQVSLGDLPAGGPGDTQVPAGLLVAWTVLLGTVVPFVVVLAGIARTGATRAGLLGTCEPVLAGVVALVVLGETLAPVQVVGGLVVLAGIVLAESARAAALPVPPASPSAPPTATSTDGR